MSKENALKMHQLIFKVRLNLHLNSCLKILKHFKAGNIEDF